MKKTILLSALALVFFACNQNNTAKNEFKDAAHTTEKKQEMIAEKNTISIGTFSEIPEDFFGCSCMMYSDKQAKENKQISYVVTTGDPNDKNSLLMSINGKSHTFTQTDFKRKDDSNAISQFSDGTYEVIIETQILKQASGEEWGATSILEIKDKNGNSNKITLQGSCGC